MGLLERFVLREENTGLRVATLDLVLALFQHGRLQQGRKTSATRHHHTLPCYGSGGFKIYEKKTVLTLTGNLGCKSCVTHSFLPACLVFLGVQTLIWLSALEFSDVHADIAVWCWGSENDRPMVLWCESDRPIVLWCESG